jgi:hypothetical protein
MRLISTRFAWRFYDPKNEPPKLRQESGVEGRGGTDRSRVIPGSPASLPGPRS